MHLRNSEIVNLYNAIRQFPKSEIVADMNIHIKLAKNARMLETTAEGITNANKSLPAVFKYRKELELCAVKHACIGENGAPIRDLASFSGYAIHPDNSDLFKEDLDKIEEKYKDDIEKEKKRAKDYTEVLNRICSVDFELEMIWIDHLSGALESQLSKEVIVGLLPILKE